MVLHTGDDRDRETERQTHALIKMSLTAEIDSVNTENTPAHVTMLSAAVLHTLPSMSRFTPHLDQRE